VRSGGKVFVRVPRAYARALCVRKSLRILVVNKRFHKFEPRVVATSSCCLNLLS
jgi:hypothetical protein